MATRKTSILFSNVSDVAYDAWATEIEDALIAFGWTVASDTGQTDPHSNPARPTAGTFKYRIYEPADGLQTGATKYYLKFEYGSDGGSIQSPKCAFSVGTGTNGAGTLTGLVIGRYLFPLSNIASETVPTFWYFSGDIDRFTWVANAVADARHNFIMTVERTKDATGVNSADGVTLIQAVLADDFHQRSLAFGVGLGWETSAVGRFLTLNNSQFNQTIPICQIEPLLAGFGNPMTTIGLFSNADIGNGQIEFETELYGATRNMLTTGNNAGAPSAAQRYFVRYD